MSAERDPVDALEDTLHNMALARSFIGDSATVDPVDADAKTLHSVVRAREVIGEATKRVSSSSRGMDPAIPWKEMAGMRDKLIHACETVHVQLVLKTVRERITETPRIHRRLDNVSIIAFIRRKSSVPSLRSS